MHLAADPFPEVSDLAMKVLNCIAYKVMREREISASFTPKQAHTFTQCQPSWLSLSPEAVSIVALSLPPGAVSIVQMQLNGYGSPKAQ